MTIQELGSLGELISSIAVLVTLIYLTVQIRQTRNATVASAMHANRAEFQAIMIANRDSLIAPIIIKADRGDALTGEEEYRLRNHINIQWNLLYSNYVQKKIGYIEAYAPSDKVALGNIFVRYGGRAANWWEAQDRKIYPSDFVNYVEDTRQV